MWFFNFASVNTDPVSRPMLQLFFSQAHFILDEMISNGFVVETNKAALIAPIELLDKAT